MKNTHFIYGLVTALAMIVLGVVLHIADLSFEPWVQWVTYLVMLVGIILNAIAFSKANNHNVTFGNVFSSGFKATALIIIIMIVWSFISMMLFPEIKEKAIEMAREKMEAQGGSEEAIEMGIEMTQKYFTAFMIGGIVGGFLFFGAIFSLIGAAIAKKNPQPAQHL
jgi:hypothetical protein